MKTYKQDVYLVECVLWSRKQVGAKSCWFTGGVGHTSMTHWVSEEDVKAFNRDALKTTVS